jgi:hypothetical protein
MPCRREAERLLWVRRSKTELERRETTVLEKSDKEGTSEW